MNLSKIQYSIVFFISFFLGVTFYTIELRCQSNIPPLIPLPKHVIWPEGNFQLSTKTRLIIQSVNLNNYFVSQIKNLTGLNLISDNSGSSSNDIMLKIDSSLNNLNNESYSLSVSKGHILISSSTEEGLFRGIQTLFQLIPSSIKKTKSVNTIEIPCCTINDNPEFSWRGLNLDCSRHFMTKDFIKRYIDILAYYKFNIFHWHLTDDQGWRIEIKKYPKLTQIGAWRKESDGSIYGGFYTQEDVKEIVTYANSRFITIVPEIEMPGHSLASLSSYPENSCTGGPFKVATTWGVFNDIYCAGKDSTFIFLQNILDEVVNLFPGQYIHIGGDEAPKVRWKVCPFCQARIKSENLKDEIELQSWFIKRIANYLSQKGKKVIGWDEVLQGGLASGIIIQSWQSFQGAIDAAKLGHYSICSPESHTYFNTSPEELDLRKVYSFDPVPDSLNKDQRKYILGGEANLWTETSPQEIVDDNLFPRLLAVSEILWSYPQLKNYDEFYSRVQKSYDDLSALGINYGIESKPFTYKTQYSKNQNEFIVTINPLQIKSVIRFTLDNRVPDSTSFLYNDPIIISKPVNLKVAFFNGNHLRGSVITLPFVFHKALGAKISLNGLYADRYNGGGGLNSLTDGIKGTLDFHDGLWQGYEGIDFEGIIDLGEELEISKVSPSFLSNVESWIFLPEQVEISLSRDNINYKTLPTICNNIPLTNSDIFIKDFPVSFNKEIARFIKVKAVSIKKCPPWHSGAGGKAWLFIDEIIVE